MAKHLTIRDADTNEEFETEEIEPSEDKNIPAEETIPEPEVSADEPADGVCCFSDDEMAALKSLIELLPDLKALLEYEAKEHADKQEDIEVKETEEDKTNKDEDDENDEASGSDDESVTDSIGSNEPAAAKIDTYSDQEAIVAARFNKYYGGK